VTRPAYRHFEEWRTAVIEHLCTTHGIPRHKGAQFVTEDYAAPSYEMGLDPIRFADEEAASLQAGGRRAEEDNPHVFASMAEARRVYHEHKRIISQLREENAGLREEAARASEEGAQEERERALTTLRMIRLSLRSIAGQGAQLHESAAHLLDALNELTDAGDKS
jgi:ABC-type Zn uptake system ZnuABC Zn-binding protein ZnuA